MSCFLYSRQMLPRQLTPPFLITIDGTDMPSSERLFNHKVYLPIINNVFSRDPIVNNHH